MRNQDRETDISDQERLLQGYPPGARDMEREKTPAFYV
jgi:hypothetical protein